MICPQCGFVSSASEDKCPNCGAQQAAGPEAGGETAQSVPNVEQFQSAPPPADPPVAAPAPQQNVFVDNDSGTPGAILPAELNGFNTGALFLNFIWAISNNVWIGLLTLIPVVGIVMPFVLGFKGNEWAWQKRRWNSIEHFRETQKKWTQWGIGTFAVSIGCGWFPLMIMAAILFPVFARARENARRASCQSHLKQISLAMLMYTQDYDECYPQADGNEATHGWAESLRDYTRDPAWFQCPTDTTPAGTDPTRSGYTDYLYNSSLSGKYLGDISNPQSVFSMADGSGANPASTASYAEIFDADGAPNGNPLHFDGLNYAYADGHIKWKKWLGEIPEN